MEIQEINLRSRRLLSYNHPPSPPVEVEEEKEESNTQIQQPPFPERLIHPSQHTAKETELLGELKNLCVNISLIHAIKDVPIYNRLIKENFLKKPGRKKKYTPTINVVGYMYELMFGRVIFPK